MVNSWVWWTNNNLLRRFIIQHISTYDFDIILPLVLASEIYNVLRTRHEKLSLHAHVIFNKKLSKTHFRRNVPLTQTLTVIKALHQSIVNLGPYDADHMLCTYILYSLGLEFCELQSTIQAMTLDPNCTSATIIQRLEFEEELNQRRGDQGLEAYPDALSNALVARSGSSSQPQNACDCPPRPTCTNCRCVGHTINFCIQPGGKMAGRTIEEAQAAQMAMRPRTQRTTQT
jgi:gag-polypeptide of LTR copia-type